MVVWKKIGEGECRCNRFVLGAAFGSLFLGLYFFFKQVSNEDKTRNGMKTRQEMGILWRL